MERMFVDPATGDIHPESYYHRENIDLATVIEAVREGDTLGFVIIPENIQRMKIRHDAVFELMKEFMINLTEKFLTADDDAEKESLREVGVMISLAMVRNLQEMQGEERRSNLH
jgi:hypothetical protein